MKLRLIGILFGLASVGLAQDNYVLDSVSSGAKAPIDVHYSPLFVDSISIYRQTDTKATLKEGKVNDLYVKHFRIADKHTMVGTQERVVVECVIEIDGRVGEVRVLKAGRLDYFNRQAIAAVERTSTLWKAAELQGKKVRSYYRAIVTFVPLESK